MDVKKNNRAHFMIGTFVSYLLLFVGDNYNVGFIFMFLFNTHVVPTSALLIALVAVIIALMSYGMTRQIELVRIISCVLLYVSLIIIYGNTPEGYDEMFNNLSAFFKGTFYFQFFVFACIGYNIMQIYERRKRQN